MKLINIKGDTYYIKGGTNTGIVKLDNSSALVIDPGLGGMRPRKIMELLENNHMDVKYIINTHEHEDHYEGCNQIKQSNKGIHILSSKEAKKFIDDSCKFADYILGGKSNRFLIPKVCKEKDNLIEVDTIVNEGEIVLNNKKIEIIKLTGHSEGSIGILTEDKVLFVGDLFVGANILSKFELLLMYDVKSYFESINKIKNIDFDYMILGHGKEIYSKKESELLIESHINAINKYITQVKELLKLPVTVDNILKSIINNNNLSCDYKEYYFFRSSILSIISYLCDLNLVDYSIEKGEMLYYSKKA
ncbi:MBL fold metallo-hydrolase [Terrisporobacter sp.]